MFPSGILSCSSTKTGTQPFLSVSMAPAQVPPVSASEATSLTWTINKVTRGADGADAVVAAQTKTADLSAATAKAVDEHKIVLTITTPFWIDKAEYVLVECALAVGLGGNTVDFLGAVAYYTFRI